MCRFPKHGGLADHMATLSDFFLDQAEKDTSTRSTLFYKCLRYVTVSCWRKMHRRMDNWISMGYIYQMAVVPSASIVSEAETISTAADEKPRSDENLYRLLIQLASGTIKGIMNQFCLSPDDNIDSLMTALELKYKSGDWSSSVYNKDVCLEFHRFLIALLLGYGRSLCRLYECEMEEGKRKEEANRKAAANKREEANKSKEVAKEHKDKQGKNKKEKKTKTKTKMDTAQAGVEKFPATAIEATVMDDICTYSRLLWTVVNSRLYHDHSRVMRKLFQRPSPDYADQYKKWARFGGTVARGEEANRVEEKDDNNAGSPGVDQAGKRDDDDNYGQSDATADGAEDGDENDQEEDGGEEEMELNIDLAHFEMFKDFEMFKAWLKLNTSHFTALQKTAGCHLPKVQFPLVEVVPPEIPVLDWHKFINNFMTRRRQQAGIERALKNLQKIIDENAYEICHYFGINPDSKSKSEKAPENQKEHFNIGAGKVRFSGNRHCELEMVSLVAFPPPAHWPISSEIREMLSVRF